MGYRPYFKYGIEQIQALVAASRGDLKTLKVIQYELGFRSKPKARALKADVDALVLRLSDGMPASSSISNSDRLPMATAQESAANQSTASAPDRVVVHCAHCNTPNFVSPLDGVVQHLSCSACKAPFEAQYKYGVMRTTFHAKPTSKPAVSPFIWVILGLVALFVIAFLAT